MTDTRQIQFICVESYCTTGGSHWNKGDKLHMYIQPWKALKDKGYWTPVDPNDLFMEITTIKEKEASASAITE